MRHFYRTGVVIFNMQKLQNTIMRGIYYAYAIRLATLPGVWQGFLMLGIIAILTRLVSLGNVLHNLLGIRIGELHSWLYGSLRGTESGTLFLLVLFACCLFSMRNSFAKYSMMRRYAFAG